MQVGTRPVPLVVVFVPDERAHASVRAVLETSAHDEHVAAVADGHRLAVVLAVLEHEISTTSGFELDPACCVDVPIKYLDDAPSDTIGRQLGGSRNADRDAVTVSGERDGSAQVVAICPIFVVGVPQHPVGADEVVRHHLARFSGVVPISDGDDGGVFVDLDDGAEVLRRDHREALALLGPSRRRALVHLRAPATVTCTLG